MSKNKISVLPTYIADMKELKILKLDHNPIIYPPRDVWDVDDASRDTLVHVVQQFLRQDLEKQNAAHDTESDNSR